MNYGNVLAIVERALGLFEAGRLSRREVAGLTVGAIGAALGSRAAQAVDSPVAAAARPPLFQATELNHAALRVTDIERSERFYRETLGLETIRSLRTVRFMACGPHFVALFQADAPGLDHLAFSWPEYDQAESVRRLETAGLKAETEEGRTYFRDPDGLQLQLAWNEDWPGSGPRPAPCGS